MRKQGCILLASLALLGCELPEQTGLHLSFLKASGRAGACSVQGTALSTHELRWLQLSMDGVEGRSYDRLLPATLSSHRIELDDVPIGEDWTITVAGYRNQPEAQARIAWWRAGAKGIQTLADITTNLDLLFSRPNQPDCARGGPSRSLAFSTATTLDNGRALLAGGISEIGDSDSCEGCRQGSSLRAAWIFDSTTGAFERTGDLPVPTAGHRAVRLSDGRVLVVGGARRLILGGDWPILASAADLLDTAAVWDPATGLWTQVMGAPKRLHHRMDLQEDELIVTGGLDETGQANALLMHFGLINSELMEFQDRRVDTGCGRAGHLSLAQNDSLILYGGEHCEDGPGPQRYASGVLRNLDPQSWDSSANVSFAEAGKLADGSWLILGGVTPTESGFRAPALSASRFYLPADNRILRAPLLPEDSAVLFPSVRSVDRGRTVLLAGGFRDLSLQSPSAKIIRYDDRTEASRSAMPLLRDRDGQPLELSQARGGMAMTSAGDHLVFIGGLINCDSCPGGQGSTTLTELFLPEEGL